MAEDGQGGEFPSLAIFSTWANAGWAAVDARTGFYQGEQAVYDLFMQVEQATAQANSSRYAVIHNNCWLPISKAALRVAVHSKIVDIAHQREWR